jgi:hypothetical protein
VFQIQSFLLLSFKKEKKMTIEKSLHPTETSAVANQLSNKVKGISKVNSIQKTARFAGLLYLIITVAATIAHFYVPSNIIVPGDAAATANNIMNNVTLFRVGGVGGELIVLLSEIVLSVILYVILKPVNKTLSLLAAVSRLAMTIIHGLNLINYFFVLLLLGGGYSTVFGTEQLQALVMLFLDAHSYGFTIGIAFLTIHVFILGYLIFKSGYFPKILGVLFVAAAFGYLFDSFALLLSTSYTTTPIYFALPITISEIAFPLWLLIKGVNLEGWRKRTLATD